MKYKLLIAVASAAILFGLASTSSQADGIGLGGIGIGGSGGAAGIGVSVGSNATGGTTATVSALGTTTTVSIGGTGSNIASATTNTGSNSVTAAVGNTNGPLATVTQNGSDTAANVNLGGLLDGNSLPGLDDLDDLEDLTGLVNDTIQQANDTVGSVLDGIDIGGVVGGIGTGDGVGNGGGGGSNAGGTDDSPGVVAGIGGAYRSIDTAEQQLLKTKCRNVLTNQRAYAKNIVVLCKMIASL